MCQVRSLEFAPLLPAQSWGVSLVAQTGLQFDLRSGEGKLIDALMAAVAEFERDLLRERPCQRVKADRFAPKMLLLVGESQSYGEISHRLGLSKNTILDIVKRGRVA